MSLDNVTHCLIDADVRQNLRLQISEDPFVTLEDLPDGGLRVTTSGRHDQSMHIAWACLAMGVVALAAGLLLMKYPLFDPHDNPFPSAPLVITVMGGFLLGIAMLLILVRKLNGPPVDAVIEASPGILKADRTVAGDRMRSTYSPQEVHFLFVDASHLFINARKGELSLIPFGQRRVNQAIAVLLAHLLWNGQEVFTASTRIGSIERWFIGPQRSGDA